MYRLFGIGAALTLLAAVLAACGGDNTSTTTSASSTSTSSTTSSTTSTTSTTADVPTDGCTDAVTVPVDSAGTHFDRDFTALDYPTNPPTGGDHNPTPIKLGKFYGSPPPLGESVHALEHGAVIGWTNGLSGSDQKAVEDAFNEAYADGYTSLAVVENPDLDGAFALSAWGAMQVCGTVDTDVIRPFVEEYYGSDTTAEGGLACTGAAKQLPACKQ